jgi:hypothetical protein
MTSLSSVATDKDVYQIAGYYLKDNPHPSFFYPDRRFYNIFMVFATEQLRLLSETCSKLNFPLYHSIQTINHFNAQPITTRDYTHRAFKSIVASTESFGINIPKRIYGHDEIVAFNQSIEDTALVVFWKAFVEDLNDEVRKVLPDLNPDLTADQIRVVLEANKDRLKNIEVILLDQLSIHSLPKEIGLFTGLKTLNCEDNYLSSLPNEINNLQNLEILRLSDNCFETFPPQITNLSNLQTLNFCNSEIKTIPIEFFQRMHHLEELYLGACDLSEIPREIENLTNLRRLGVERNPRLRNLPIEIHNLNRLEYLGVSEHTAIPEGLEGITQVWDLTDAED